MSENIINVTDGSFDEDVLQSDQPVVVDFWAPWCGPCKSIAPVLEQIAEEFSGKVKVAKMNVDDNPETPVQYNVKGIPNIVFFKNGEVADKQVGAVPKSNLVTKLEALF